MAYRILAINPGATSTKIAVYEDHKPILSKSIAHDSQRIDGFETVEEQANYRKHIIQGVLDDAKFDMNTLHIIMCRG
ncbi:MAG: butyrate kinase, partial [Anaerovorax sp.]